MNNLVLRSNDSHTTVHVTNNGREFLYAILWHEGQTIYAYAVERFFLPILEVDFDDLEEFRDTKLLTITPMHAKYKELYAVSNNTITSNSV